MRRGRRHSSTRLTAQSLPSLRSSSPATHIVSSGITHSARPSKPWHRGAGRRAHLYPSVRRHRLHGGAHSGSAPFSLPPLPPVCTACLLRTWPQTHPTALIQLLPCSASPFTVLFDFRITRSQIMLICRVLCSGYAGV